ncbi:MAG: hypothetical protein AAF411_14465 [Myxococcota bacterium]
MQGNPFSTTYYNARRRGPADPYRYSSMHVAVYERRGRRSKVAAWALETQPIDPRRDRTAERLAIGNSMLRWEGDRLVADLDERTTPPPKGNPFRWPVHGRVVIHPEAMPGVGLPIDEHGRHLWWPVAPVARFEVDLFEPRLRFSGHGYHDANAGDRPLDESFDTWSWMRARVGHAARLTYDVRTASGVRRAHALEVRPDGVYDLEDTKRVSIERSAWGLARDARVDRGRQAHTVQAYEDGPFYTRSLLKTHIGGDEVLAMHETLAAHRLRRAWVRHCATYRMRER